MNTFYVVDDNITLNDVFKFINNAIRFYVHIVYAVKVPQGILDKVSMLAPLTEGEVIFEDLAWEMKFVSPFELQVSVKHDLGTEVVATLDVNSQSHTGWFSLDKSSEVYCLGIVERE